jgi:UDP-N-acetylglucosamine 4,6-dehydratase
MFKDEALLITGGAGSFGNAVPGRFPETAVSGIRVFGRLRGDA